MLHRLTDLAERAYRRHLRREIDEIPAHVAVIQDGNRRYAREQGYEAPDGHRAGADTTERVLDWCADLGIAELTLYAFSTENFARPADEREALFDLLERKLRDFADADRVHEQGVRVRALGDVERLPERVREAAMRSAETAWQAAQEVAGEQLTAAQQQWDQERVDAESMRKELADAYDAAQADAEGLRAQLEQMQSAAEQAVAEHAEVVRRMEDERRQIEGRATKAEQEAQHQRSIADRLEGEQKQLRESLDAETERRVRAEQITEGLRSDVSKLQTQADQAKKEYAEAVRHLEEGQTKLREQLASANDRAVRAEQRAEGLNSQVEQMQALREQLDAAKDRCARAEQQVADLNAELTRERERLDALLQGQGKPQAGRGPGSKKDA